MKLFNDTEDRLGRELKECEVRFLTWIHERHENELTVSDVAIQEYGVK